MGYLFDLEGPIAQPIGYDREDGATTCRANRDILFWNVAENFTTQQYNYYLKNNTYDGLVFKHEVIDITPEGEIQIFINVFGGSSERKRQILKYSTNYLGKFCCEQQFSQYIVPQIEKLSVDMTGKSYFNLPSGTKAFWDDNTQTCRIKPVAAPSDSCATTFKIVLNPKGNDGNIFNVGANDTDCSLNVEFDYLFKLDCAKLQQLMVNAFDPQGESTSEINILRQEIAIQETKCETIRQEITTLTTEYSNTSYSVTCDNFTTYITPEASKVSPLSFNASYTCVNEGVGKKGYRTLISNIQGGTPPYKYNIRPALTKEDSIIGKVFEVNIPNNTLNIFNYPLDTENFGGNNYTSGSQGEPNFNYTLSQIAWFTVTDSKGLSLSKSITLNCSLNTETTTTTTTTTTNGGTTGGGTTTTTGGGRGGRGVYYPEVVDGGYIPSPYLPDWGETPIWFSDPYTRTTTYNFANKPYRNPITPVKVVSNNFNNTGFGDISSTTPFAFYQYGRTAANTSSKTFCISEPNGLAEWQKILGPVNYEKFTRGDSTSYTCQQVATLYKLQETNGQIYLTECTTAFTTKSIIKQRLDTKIIEQTNCNTQLELLNAQLTTLLAQQTTTETTTCKTITDVLETLDVSFTLDVVESDGSLTTVYEFPLFPTIGTGNLYEYLLEKQNDSGFYVCGKPDEDELVWAEKDECVPLIFEKYNLYGPSAPLGFYMFECEGRTTQDGDLCNVSSCRFTRDMILKSLYNQSGYEIAEIETFKGSLSQKIMSSNWLNYNEVIDDPNILESIKNKKIKISLKVNNTCSDICVMLDNIKLNKECVNGTEGFVTLTQSPGFNLTRIVDNKKSWVSNTTYVNREFVISNPTGGTSIRNTDYEVLDERLVINTKEIDLNMNIASAIETDVWCYINDNNDILNVYSGLCNPNVIAFSCPNGYNTSPSNDSCYSSSTIAATFSGTMFTAYTGQKVTSYNNFGARFYENIDNFIYPLTLPSSTVTDSSGTTVSVQKLVSTGNTFWSNNAGNYSDGRLNDAGVWGTYLANPSGSSTNYPEYEWIGFTVCIDILEPKVYYLGLASDNWLRFKINGELIVNFNQTNARNFNYLHVFPISIPSGPTIIEVEGYNAGSQAAFVAEIYNPDSLDTLTASTTTGTTGLIFSTKQMIGSQFLLSVSNGYSCPSGYSLNNCSGGTPVCTSISRNVISATTGTTIDTCGCGSDCVSYDSLTSTNLANISSDVNFKEIISSEMIDVKNRKTISKYATLRAFYDKYLHSSLYTTNLSLAYTYDKMRSLTDMVGNYWTDIVEQVIPSTTIWGNTIIYGNTLFDQQKFQYKTGNLMTCIDGFKDPSNTSWDFLNECVYAQIEKFYSTCGSECESGDCNEGITTITRFDLMDDIRGIPTSSELDSWGSSDSICNFCNYSSLQSVIDSYIDNPSDLDNYMADVRDTYDTFYNTGTTFQEEMSLGYCYDEVADELNINGIAEGPNKDTFKKMVLPTSPRFNQPHTWPWNFFDKGVPKKTHTYYPAKISLNTLWYGSPGTPISMGMVLSAYTDQLTWRKAVSSPAELPLIGQPGDVHYSESNDLDYIWDPQTQQWVTGWSGDFEDYKTTYRANRDAWLKAWNELRLSLKPFTWASNYLLLHPFKKWVMQNATPVTGKQIIETDGKCLPCEYKITVDCEVTNDLCLGKRNQFSEFDCDAEPLAPAYINFRNLDLMDDLNNMPSGSDIDLLYYTATTCNFSSINSLTPNNGPDGSDFGDNSTEYRQYSQDQEAKISDIIDGMYLGFKKSDFPSVDYNQPIQPITSLSKYYSKGTMRRIKYTWWSRASAYTEWNTVNYPTHGIPLSSLLSGVSDVKYLSAVSTVSELPTGATKGDLICVGTSSSHVDYAWDPILNSWSTGLHDFIEEHIFVQRRLQKNASMVAKRNMVSSIKPMLWANEYLFSDGTRNWSMSDVSANTVNTITELIATNGANLPPKYTITASTHTLSGFTATTIIY
jgi:hypothetical protein